MPSQSFFLHEKPVLFAIWYHLEDDGDDDDLVLKLLKLISEFCPFVM